jgi:hypothetical protein
LNTGHVGLAQLCDAGTQLGGVAVASIDDHQIARKVRLTGPPDLLERNLRLGLEVDLLGDACFAPTLLMSFGRYSR